MKNFERYLNLLEDHSNVFFNLAGISTEVHAVAELLLHTLKVGKKVLICGNGGSASDAQHFSAELVGRFALDRKALPAIALNTDTSILTALGNDYGYDSIFARQVEGLGQPSDCLIGISTSGNSKNVTLAVEAAKQMDIRCIGLLGNDGGELVKKCDLAVVVPSKNTARIQEAHIFLIHFLAGWIEEQIFGSMEKCKGASQV